MKYGGDQCPKNRLAKRYCVITPNRRISWMKRMNTIWGTSVIHTIDLRYEDVGDE